ncbi:hypothetical protein CERSUDRAFT_118629, partial [Gelatoporia subvermispora B]
MRAGRSEGGGEPRRRTRCDATRLDRDLHKRRALLLPSLHARRSAHRSCASDSRARTTPVASAPVASAAGGVEQRWRSDVSHLAARRCWSATACSAPDHGQPFAAMASDSRAWPFPLSLAKLVPPSFPLSKHTPSRTSRLSPSLLLSFILGPFLS